MLCLVALKEHRAKKRQKEGTQGPLPNYFYYFNNGFPVNFLFTVLLLALTHFVTKREARCVCVCVYYVPFQYAFCFPRERH